MSRFAFACLLLGACTLTHDDPPPPTPTSSMIEVATYPAIPTSKLDILFQVDNSPSVADVQQAFVGALPDFLAAIDVNGRPDLHIGVVNSDLGTSASTTPPAPALGNRAGEGFAGNLQVSNAPVSGTFISDVSVEGPVGRNVNYTGDLVSALGTMLKVGAVGCGFEQQLRATREALDGNSNNAGFARSDANLLVVVLTDEDDCSVRDSAMFQASAELGTVQSFRCTRFGVTCDQPLDSEGTKTNCRPDEASAYVDGIQSYTDFFSSLRGDRARTAVAVIAAPPTPFAVELRTLAGTHTSELALAHGCDWEGSTGPEVGDPGVRLAALTDQLQSHGLFHTVCQQNQRQHAREIVNLANQMAGIACLDTRAVDATLCDVTVDGASGTRKIPACDGAATDCFELVTDAAACPTTVDNTRLVTHLSSPTSDEYVRVSCSQR
ncbi:MAG TPA: hypothetical protein VGM90_07685 [Kofleriaceae bacterium]|jgi:hypothetical protein